MRAKQESCSFSGHRPEKLPWAYQEHDPRCIRLKERIADSIETAWQEGYRHFLCGMAMGCDFYFCECIQNLRRRLSGITLEAAIPCPSHDLYWPPSQRYRYQLLLDQCDLQTMVSERYTPLCMQRRDRYMIDHSSMLIAAFNGSPGGTRYTLEYAMRNNLRIIDLRIDAPKPHAGQSSGLFCL